MDDEDPRPGVWVGHVVMRAPDVGAADAWMQGVGMRSIVSRDDIAVLELRGGTHLVIQPGPDAAGADIGFDLMVDDLDATHADYAARGLDPSGITRGGIHDSFTVAAPSGHTVTVNSTHVGDQPV